MRLEGPSGGSASQRSWLRLPSLRTLSRVFAGLILTCITVAAMFYGKEPMSEMLVWLEGHNNARGMAYFVAAETVAVALLLPAVPLIIAAGVVFGFAKGVVCVWIAASIGQVFAFLLSRYILRDCMVEIMQKRFAMWEALDKAIQVDGWKLILLLRVSPLVPYNVMNVLLGSSGIHFSTFVFFSTIGIIPECLITVYFGTLAGNVANVINGRAGPQGAAKLGLVAVGGLMMVAAALYAAFVTRKAVRRAVARADKQQASTAAGLSRGGSPTLADVEPMAVPPTIYVDQPDEEGPLGAHHQQDLESGGPAGGHHPLRPTRSALLFAGITAGIPMVHQSYDHMPSAVPAAEKDA